jgi:hypothetical protein
MNRDLWVVRAISKTECPDWQCPVCHSGTLMIQKDSLISEETIPSQQSRAADEFEPEWIEYAFTAWARCSNAKCKQKFAIGGKGGVEPQYEEGGDLDYHDFFSPLFCYPMPHIIDIPKSCPSDIALELEASFSVFWSNPAACAGRIRVALEMLMDHLGVPKRKKATAGGKFKPLSLHKRIEEYAAKEPKIGPQLMALKWLGNAGSHTTGVNSDDLLDAFEVLEHALRELLEKRHARVTTLARKLLKKHGRK